MDEKEQGKGLSMNIKPEIAEGKYSNLAVITHSQSEFVLDFASMLPGMPEPVVVNRVLMVPEHAKKLLIALQDNVSKYEAQFGQISLGRQPKNQGATINLGDFLNKNTKS